jgi:phosphate starvation-inducible PhoH-like protein
MWMSDFKELGVHFHTIEESVAILGQQDRNLHLIEDYFKVRLITRGEKIVVDEAVPVELQAKIVQLISTLKTILNFEPTINERDILYAFKMLEEDKLDEFIAIYQNKMVIGKDFNGKSFSAKTVNQKIYLKSIEKNDLVFGVGPAGTGKTFLAVIKGVA